MKITKFVHSCLLVEDDDKTYLFDPGQFSWESGLFDAEKLRQLDTVIITHEHFDHFHPPFVQALAKQFPDVCFISTPPVVEKLQSMGVQNAFCESTDMVHVFSTKRHASLTPLGEAPENIAVHVHDRLTVGGDRHDLEESKEILALSVTAPWGHMMGAAGMAVRLKPSHIIPVHDWHWNDKARAAAYDTLEQFFAKQNMTFIKPTDGQPFEL